MKLLATLILSALSILTCFAQTHADTLKAAEIINKSEEAYAHLKSYVDSGKLIQDMIRNGRSSKTALIFKTAYTSNGDFNFDYYKVGQSNSLYTINRTNNVVKTWWGLMNREASPKNIEYAMAEAAGVSSSTSSIISEFLMRVDFKGRNYYRQLKTHVLTGIEKVNGTDCYKIKGAGLYGATAIWIGKKDFLIRKIELESVVDPVNVAGKMQKIADGLKKKDSVKYSATIKATERMAENNKRDSLRGASRQPFTVKDVYVFVPVIDHKINPGLLKFRPNREVAL